MPAFLYAHVPGLKLEESEAPFAGGRLTRLPFDDWMSLESEFECSDAQYAKSDPVFWVREVVVDSGLAEDEIERTARTAVWPLHTAFLLDVRSPLIPTPDLSCCYVVVPAGPETSHISTQSVARLIGPMEREFIVYGSPLIHNYSRAELNFVDRLYHFIEVNGIRDLLGPIGAGIEVLEETARPDSWYGGDKRVCHMHGFVRCMAACENILLQPDEADHKTEITQTFGRRAAALFAPSVAARGQAEKHFADLYRFRSELMHGRLMPDEGDSASDLRLREGRQLLRNIILAALLLRNALPAEPALSLLLEERCNDPDRQTDLHRILAEGLRT